MWWLDVSPATTALLLPLGIFSALAFGTCLGLLVAPIGMLYQDVEKAIIMLVGFWMFLTPVVMPRAAEGLASKLMAWNPATPIVECTRNWLVGEPNTSLTAFVLVTLTSILLLLIGWVLYRVALPHAIARLGM